MENASKALIIAGAILLAIVLVSLGVLVINNSRSEIDTQSIEGSAIEAFNAKITAYCGTQKSGTDMNNLIDTITSSNGAQRKKAEPHLIDLTWTDAGGVAHEYPNDASVDYPIFQNNRKYRASAKTDSKGYVFHVYISLN